MSGRAGVRARQQPKRFHPGNFLKNLNDKFTNALVVVEEEPESAESQEARKYSDLNFDGLFSGEILLLTSYNGKNKGRPETPQAGLTPRASATLLRIKIARCRAKGVGAGSNVVLKSNLQRLPCRRTHGC